MNIWTMMLLGGLLTFGTRLFFIVLVGEREVPPWVKKSLRFVPPAVLTAIIFPELLLPGGKLDISLGNARLLAGVVAILVAWRTRSAVLTIVIGMLALWLLQWLIAR
jgi:branched-subunit amino acid transport protein